jgi:pimeloyl-ACP methyl ester carboxylesterase
MSGPKLLLLHGAGTSAWVWSRLEKELGTSALALDVPGRVAGATPSGCADALVAELERRGGGEVVAVLHSLAGVLGPGLAIRLGPRLKRCIFVSAVVPPDGRAFIDAVGLANRFILRALFKFKPNGLKPSPSMIRRSICSDLDPTTAEEVISRYAAEMPGLYLATAEKWPSGVRTSYVKLLEDRSLSVRKQDAMIARLDSPRVRELKAGHLAMLSEPVGLARILDEEAQL